MAVTVFDSIDFLNGGTDNELARKLGAAAAKQADNVLSYIKPVAERQGEAVFKKLAPVAAEQAAPAADKLWSALQDKANEEFSFDVLGFTVTPKMLAVAGAVALGALVVVGIAKAVKA